jgi:uncharacterized protein
MKINVAQLLKEPSGYNKEYELNEDISTLDPEILPLSALTGQAVLFRLSEGVFVRADLRTNIELNCSRCLDPFSYPLKFRVEEEFHPMIDITTGASLPRPEDDDEATRIDAHHILDLSEVVRQDLLLALPPHPLCRNGCAGLCPVCGQNLNDNPHRHEDEHIDPRLEVLKELLKK